MTRRRAPAFSHTLPSLLALLALLISALLLCSCGDSDQDKGKSQLQKQAEQAQPRGNSREDSFQAAKRELDKRVYFDHRVTLYCQAPYDEEGNVSLPKGFVAAKHQARAGRIEWEHVVPAENFGRTFEEWRDGHPECQDRRGPFKGRKCAERVSREFRLMHADMYNLYPAIGAVNALRQNYNYAMLPGAKSSFGICPVKIEDGKVEPPEAARGQISRSTKYMAWAYARFRLSDQQSKLMDAWDSMYPVDSWECTRARRIEALQGNANPFVKDKCVQAGLW